MHAFLALLPSIIFVLIGLAGMIVHFSKRKVKGETTSSLAEYYLKYNFGYTIASVLATIIGVLGLIHTGIALHDAHALAAAFATGYVSDSAINKDQTLQVVSEALSEPASAAPAPAAPVPADPAPVTEAPTPAETPAAADASA